ncbi:hypothetical protein [Seonamhaeicola marinus]|uniref:hypothetical protein n=1 Tax=Seonamhaeicola marinus TaxID=1912246 RepID=UPI001CA33282|nr:hypothetical protein [Seonamhaeicola marinus]
MSMPQFTCILAANKTAMDLFKQSKETLMNSNNYDFMAFRFTQWKQVEEELPEWDEHITIDETTYFELYSNLCKKMQALVQYL